MDEEELARRGWSRDTQLRRDADGRWYDGEVLVEHPGVRRAFDAWIDRAPDGGWCLRNALHWVRVELEGPPVFVTSARLDGDSAWLALSDGREERLDPDSLHLDAEGHLACEVRGGRLPARFRPAALAAVSDALISEGETLVWVAGGRRVPLRSRSTD